MDPKLGKDRMLGRQLGNRYTLTSLLGEGGMASVYLASDNKLNRQVAVKILHDHLHSNLEIVQRFHHEAQSISKLEHPNIIRIFDYSGPDTNLHWFVTEYIRGSNLSQFLKRFSLSQVEPLIGLMIGREIAKALIFAHQNSVIHRDIKPENIMVTELGVLKLMDFGIAKELKRNEVTQVGTFMGSPSYMSPEQIRGPNIDARTDIFSLSVLIYELIAGEVPFKGQSPIEVTSSILEGRFSPLSKVRPGTPKTLDQFITKGLANKPDLRYSSMQELAEAIDTILYDQGLESSSFEVQRFFEKVRNKNLELFQTLDSDHADLPFTVRSSQLNSVPSPITESGFRSEQTTFIQEDSFTQKDGFATNHSPRVGGLQDNSEPTLQLDNSEPTLRLDGPTLPATPGKFSMQPEAPANRSEPAANNGNHQKTGKRIGRTPQLAQSQNPDNRKTNPPRQSIVPPPPTQDRVFTAPVYKSHSFQLQKPGHPPGGNPQNRPPNPYRTPPPPPTIREHRQRVRSPQRVQQRRARSREAAKHRRVDRIIYVRATKPQKTNWQAPVLAALILTLFGISIWQLSSRGPMVVKRQKTENTFFAKQLARVAPVQKPVSQQRQSESKESDPTQQLKPGLGTPNNRIARRHQPGTNKKSQKNIPTITAPRIVGANKTRTKLQEMQVEPAQVHLVELEDTAIESLEQLPVKSSALLETRSEPSEPVVQNRKKKAAPGRITVVSNAQARLLIDGRNYGRVGVDRAINLSAGSHTLQIIKPGFKTVHEKFMVVAGESQILGPFELEEIPKSMVVVKTNRRGVTLSLRDSRGRTVEKVNSRGHTISLQPLKPGTYQVQLAFRSEKIRQSFEVVGDGVTIRLLADF